jgi:hypothetical protein
MGLLKADIVRLRHRRDLWLVMAVTLALSAASWYAGMSSELNLPAGPQRTVEQAAYLFPTGIVAFVDHSMWILAAGAAIGAFWIASEFGWGTIRPSVLVTPTRWRFLGTRMVAIGGLAIGLLIATVALGAVGSIVLAGVADPMPGPAGPAITLAVTQLGLGALLYAALACLAAIITRTAGAALLLAALFGGLNALVDAGWSSIGNFFPGRHLADLSATAHVLLQGAGGAPWSASLLADVGVPTIWIACTVAVAVWIFERAEITE